MPAGKERVAEIVDHSIIHGDDETCRVFNIQRTALDRYKRTYKEHFGESADLLLKIKSRYSPTELQVIANGNTSPTEIGEGHLSFEGEDVCFGVMGDTHIGSKYTNEAFVDAALEEFDKKNCAFFLHTGDVSEGMSGRDGHCYELTHIGYKAQKEAAIKVFQPWKKPSYFIAGNHDCHSSDTECLTKRGWLKYNEILNTDEVLSYDIAADSCRWMPISSIIIKEYDGDMLSFNAQTFRQTVTPTHRMLFSDYHLYAYSGKTQYRYAQANTFLSKPKTYKAHFKVSAYCNNKEYAISDAMLRIVGWLLTDGSISDVSPTVAGNYIIYQSKDVQSIIDDLNEAGLTYSHRIRDRNIIEVCGKVLKKKPLPEQNFRLDAESARKVGKYLTNKRIPTWIYELSSRQFDILASVFLLANGSATFKGKTDIHTFALHGRKEFLEEAQILFTMHGYSSGLRTDIRGAWVLDLCRRQDSCVPIKQTLSVEKYKGIVWCISTPLTNFVIRKEGRPSFTGNCWYKNKGDMGADIVDDICKGIPGSKYLGINEGSVFINGVELRLWHGEDTGSYSTSYRLQKLVESLTGGSKPGAMFCGHTHKQGYFFERNVHMVSTGAIQSQSAWMRYKRLAAHTGFHIIKMGVANKEILWFEPRFYPFYK